jgi:hypothetical protein
MVRCFIYHLFRNPSWPRFAAEYLAALPPELSISEEQNAIGNIRFLKDPGPTAQRGVSDLIEGLPWRQDVWNVRHLSWSFLGNHDRSRLNVERISVIQA